MASFVEDLHVGLAPHHGPSKQCPTFCVRLSIDVVEIGCRELVS